jgi:transmembrane sensor
MSMDSAKSVAQRASDWLVRRELPNWTAADEAALNAWLDSSTAHRVAYLRLQAGWIAMDRLKALGAGFPRGAVPAPEQLEPGAPGWCQREERAPGVRADDRSARLRSTLKIALAAGIAAIGVAGYLGWDHSRGLRYSTPVGVTAAVPLSDGSTITLNTDSAIRLVVSESERKVELQQGEAYFDVRPDPARPFVVRAGDKRIVVLGTKFSVRRERDDVRIVVTEGKVRADGVVLTVGDVAETRDDRLTVAPRALPKAERLLSWRSGYLVFEDTTLADVVAEFNRYNEHTTRIGDPGVAGIRISGKFRSSNFESFARLLQESHGIVARRNGDTIVLTAETP